ncbi:MAG: M23 family metallopeptidase [Clostridia bacterium]|nr:M23 family metallopeptidase [Clostridia bacterium]
MDKNLNVQKKNSAMNFVYATIIGMLVVACAITIAFVGNTAQTKAEIGQVVEVSANTYIVPMENATIAKDYNAKELQYNDTLKQWEIHKAIDFVAGDNLNVYTIADGTVSKVYTNYLEGGVVEVAHANGMVSVYKSLTDVNLKVGDKVSAGQVIGQASNSMAQELNSGAHLHFEMILNGTKVDPNNYLSLGNK